VATRYSRQREAIMNALAKTKLHPSAETLYAQLKGENPGLSLGTVYRNLKQLENNGKILRMSFEVERYDANTEPHVHLKCSDCGGLFDIEPNEGQQPSLPAEKDGFLLEKREIVYYGKCPRCNKKNA